MNKPEKFFSKDFKIIECSSERQLPIMVFKIYRRDSRYYVGRINIHSANIKSLRNILNKRRTLKDDYDFKDLNLACAAVEARIKSQRNSK